MSTAWDNSSPIRLHRGTAVASAAGPRPTIVFLHGGGWAIGEPAWAYSQARHYEAKGLTTIAAQYRLSDQRRITPRDAMADTRDAMRWIRAHARALRVDRRIAAYGWSAGGHLGARRVRVRRRRGRRRFWTSQASGGRCELHVYPGLGQMLSRNLDRRAQEQGPFDPDPNAIADVFAKTDAFLTSLGFL